MFYAAWLCLLVAAELPDQPIDFDTQIVPILTRAGCNAGACHGAAAGRGGLKLSLFGADAASDFQAIVHQFEGRRINLVHPERSLLLRKATGEMEHGGEAALDFASPGFARFKAWIDQGATRLRSRQLIALKVTPTRQLCDPLPAAVPLRAIASFHDGSQEDVTAWTLFTSTDTTAVSIDDPPMAHVTRRGQHLVLARFLDRAVPISLLAPLNDQTQSNDLPPVETSENNFIDTLVNARLIELRIPRSPPATEAAWLRRVTLDLTGRLPDPESILAFLDSDDPDKREQVVDRLLASDAFVDYWTLRFAKLLRMHSLPDEREGFQAYRDWLRESLRNDVGWDQLAKQLLLTTGDAHTVGPANFHRMVNDARAQAELVGQFFAGVQLGCANCHNHPLDRWTQDDYHGLAAIFARLDRGRQVRLLPRGEVTNPRTGEPAAARIPGVGDLMLVEPAAVPDSDAAGDAEQALAKLARRASDAAKADQAIDLTVTADSDPRAVVLAWVLAKPQQLFARATVNRLWQAMFGRGLVEPPDDMRATNPATHPELLTQLAADFAANGYRIRPTLKRLALSQTYARSDLVLAGNEADDRFYSRSYHRPLSPEVLLDAFVDVTGVSETFGDQDVERAVQVIDPALPAGSLDRMGRCRRLAGCGESAQMEANLATQLHLLNGELLNQKLRDPKGHLQQRIKAGATTREIVADFYLRGLGRPATSEELVRWERLVTGDSPLERQPCLEDFVWSLLQSRAFCENH